MGTYSGRGRLARRHGSDARANDDRARLEKEGRKPRHSSRITATIAQKPSDACTPSSQLAGRVLDWSRSQRAVLALLE
jgi:hypothetical protein